MNILILNWKDIKNPHVGGAEVIAFEYARRLVKDGHKVTFFARSFTNAKDRETIDGVQIIRKGNKFSVYIQAYFYYASLKKKPDKVIDMVNTLCWQTPLYVPKDKRIAYVNQLAQEVLFYELPWPLSYSAYLLEKYEYLPYKNTKFLCYSQSTKEDLMKYKIPEKNISLFPLGVDHKRYRIQGEKTKEPSFVFVARLVRMKRPSLCIDAMSLVVKEYPHATLHVIGNGPEEKALEEQVKDLHLEKNVFFTNKNNFYIDQNKKDVKVIYMQKSWALLLPSVKEGWGMVVTEAAACGTPSIVSNVTGLRDSVLHNKTGIVLSKTPSSKELANTIIRFIKNKDIRIKMNKASIVWSKQFDWNTSYREFKKQIIHV